MNAPSDTLISPFALPLPASRREKLRFGRLYGSSTALVLSEAARSFDGVLVAVTPDTATALQLEQSLLFYCGQNCEVLLLPDWETLPYEQFSPHQDIISQRLETLYRLPPLDRGILVVPVSTLALRLPPLQYIASHSLIMATGDRLEIESFRRYLNKSGYQPVSQVMEHGEYAVRGNLIDIYPMGCRQPLRIDLLDEEIDSIRIFNAEDQRTVDRIGQVRFLPANEFPMDEPAISLFRKNYRHSFPGNPQNAAVYRDVSNGIVPQGIEYYIPLFFEETALLFDYLPENSLFALFGSIGQATDKYLEDVAHRYQQRRHDIEHPLLPPEALFIDTDGLYEKLAHYPGIELQTHELQPAPGSHNICNHMPATLGLSVSARHELPTQRIRDYFRHLDGRVLVIAETEGRREVLCNLFADAGIRLVRYAGWQAFLEDQAAVGIAVAQLENGLRLDAPGITVLGEAQLFGQQVSQRRRRAPATDPETIISSLSELDIGAPMVHEDHGIGRYQGLVKLTVNDIETEFFMIEYAGNDRLYVPVSSLHLITRYTGAPPEQAPLHKLGGDQWLRAKRRACERVRDVAAELLDVYTSRQARKGIALPPPDDQYAAFSAAFPFEETPDQIRTIEDVISDMTSDMPMDRLVCGDVGFGKTEVAMRAAFMAAYNGYQVAVLVPTTLLTQQHYENFCDRFSNLPIRIDALSRFRSKADQSTIIDELKNGVIDIIIGTHRLLQPDIAFKKLGLVIIDEEHRFGVRQKERFKSLRSEVDVLTLTATPIPRTLNLALSELRDLSIIATPPARRLSIRTFLHAWDNELIQEACLREIKRGGQVFFLHNEVKTIENITDKLRKLLPEEATIRVAHGQMRERELEQVMLDFYHQRFNVLVCTTIIETGIDIPTANTIVINRADRFGLAQLYQLRGRVGRSHHRAYAYLLMPDKRSITPDAVKRLEAIESIEELGTGFMLATHDLEIRGAGEILGEEQSGHMQEIGFTLYHELLDRAIRSMKEGKQPDLDRPIHLGTEIDLKAPALITDDYLPDVHTRLMMYKRIAAAGSPEELREINVEMIDRFGLLPEATKTLFRAAELQVRARPMGIKKIEAHANGGRLIFDEHARINTEQLIAMVREQSETYRFDGRDKLRFSLELPDVDARIREIGSLLDKLELEYAA